METPTASQIAAASAILLQFSREHGATASDTMRANTIYSIASVLGAPGQPAASYSAAVAQATGGDIAVTPMIDWLDSDTFKVVAENPLGLTVGDEFMSLSGALKTLDDDLGEVIEDEALPDADALDALNKDPLIERINTELAAAKENFVVTKDYGTKAELIASLMTWRGTGNWPAKPADPKDMDGTGDEVSGD